MKKRENPVELPDKKHLKILKNGYVYYFTMNKRNNDKKRPEDDRQIIGKLSEDKTKLIPNKNYFKLFNCKELEEPPKIDTTLSIGQYLAIQKTSSIYDLYKSLEKNFPKQYEKIFAYALFMLDAGDSISQHYSKWAFKNYAGLDYSISSSMCSELFENISEDSVKNFFKDYIKSYREKNNLEKRLCYAFDSTNQNTYAENITLAEYGKAKKDLNLPIINTSYFADEVTGIPLYYEIFYGSLLDKAQLKYSLKKSEELGFSKLFIIFDRGYYSAENVDSIRENSYAFLLPETLNLANDYIKTYGKDIKDKAEAYIKDEKAYGIKIKLEDEILKGKFLYIFYDSIRADEERLNLQSKAACLKEKVSKEKYFSKELQEKYEKFLIITKMNFKAKKTPPVVSINTKSIQEMMDKAGFFACLSNEEINPSEMLKMIRKRDSVEKVFKRMKCGLKLDTPYAHNDATYQGKMFVCFIALNLLETFRYLIKDYLAAVSSRTTFTALEALSKIVAYKSEDDWSQKYALTKEQKEICKHLSITEKEVSHFIRNLNL